MDTKYKVIGMIVLVVISYAFGRYSAPEKAVESKSTQVNNNVKTDDDKTTDTTKHIITKDVTVTKPDGSKQETKTIDEQDGKQITEDKKTDDQTKTLVQDTKTTIYGKKGATVLSILAGSSLSFSKSLTPVYGGSITHEIVGPINIGAFGFQNGLVGISVGLTF